MKPNTTALIAERIWGSLYNVPDFLVDNLWCRFVREPALLNINDLAYDDAGAKYSDTINRDRTNKKSAVEK